MRSLGKGLILLAILLAGSFFILGYIKSNSSPSIMPVSSNKVTDFSKKPISVYVDPALKSSMDQEQEIIVTFRSRKSLNEALNKLGNMGIEILHVYKIINAIIVRTSPRVLLDLGADIFGVSGLFANAKYHISFYAKKAFDVQSNLPNTTYTSHLIGADVFWEHGYNGSGIKVAVIDTGVNFEHPELQGKNYSEKSFVKKIYGYGIDIDDPSDGNGHGTFVAGIIAGKGLDPRGQGMAPGALIMNARVFPPGENTYATLAGIIAAIEWAAYGDDGTPNTGDEADVINLSLGGGQSFITPTWDAIWNATKLGAIVVVAAGNDGDGGLRSMSIGDPANAPAAIAAGASNAYYTMIASYSSFGPTVLLAVKPEIVAPSEVVGIYYEGGYTDRTWAGTSFSSPHTAGSIALIVDYLKNKGISRAEIPNLARSLIMYSASEFYFVDQLKEKCKYEDIMVGSGLLNLTNAYEILESSSISSSSYPQWLVVLPKKVPVGLSNSSSELHKPFFPYTEYGLALGQELAFNFSITVSKEADFSISFYGNITNALDIRSETSIRVEPPVTYWEFNVTVREDATLGYYSGYIKFEDLDNGVSFEVPISFVVYEPKIKVLWDIKHTSWALDYPYGQFRVFYRSLVQNGALVDIYYHWKPDLSVDVLSNYDLLYAPDVASLEFAYYSNGTEAYNFTYDFSQNEIDAIHEYIENGGSLLLFAMTEYSENVMVTNFSNVNELLKPYGMELIDAHINLRNNPVAVGVVSKHLLVRGIENLTHYGAAIKIIEPMEVTPLLKYSNYIVAAVYQNFHGGSVILFGTNFIFDNWAFAGMYPGIDKEGKAPRQFVSNLVEFIANYTNLFNGISLSKTSIARGDSVTVEVNLTRHENDVRWCIVNKYTEIEGPMEYDETTGTYKQTITFPIAGSNTLYIRVYLDEQTYVSPAVGLLISKTEDNPPIITFSIENESTLTLEDKLILEVNITDDTGLIMNSLALTGNITQFIANITIEKSSDAKFARISITLNKTVLEDALSNTEAIALNISVSISDLNVNTATSTITFVIKKPQIAIPTTLIYALIAIVAIIIVAIVIFKLRKK